MPTAIQYLIIFISQIISVYYILYGLGIQTTLFSYNEYKSFEIGLNYPMKKLFRYYLDPLKLQ